MNFEHKDNCDLWKLEFVFIIVKHQLKNNSFSKLKKGSYGLAINKFAHIDSVLYCLKYTKDNGYIYVKGLEIHVGEPDFPGDNMISLTYVTGLDCDIFPKIHDYDNYKKAELPYDDIKLYNKITDKKNGYNRQVRYKYETDDFENVLTDYELIILEMETLCY